MVVVTTGKSSPVSALRSPMEAFCMRARRELETPHTTRGCSDSKKGSLKGQMLRGEPLLGGPKGRAVRRNFNSRRMGAAAQQAVAQGHERKCNQAYSHASREAI